MCERIEFQAKSSLKVWLIEHKSKLSQAVEWVDGVLFQVDMSMVVEEANDKHMGPWAELCKLCGVENTPLSPFIHQELLEDKHLNLSNARLKETGFTLSQPSVTKEALIEVKNTIWTNIYIVVS